MSEEAEALARRFHEAYERLAPSFGYETREETRAFDPESRNGKLMIATCEELALDTEKECAELARVLAHVAGAVTGNLKPYVMYPGKPLQSVEEALALYRACQLMAGKIVQIREGREATEAEIQAEILWEIKVSEKEIESINPGRKIPT